MFILDFVDENYTIKEIESRVPVVSLQAALEAAGSAISAVVGSPFQGAVAIMISGDHR